MDNLTVKCPQCGKAYVIPASGLGKKGRWKECSTVFTTTVNPDPPTELDQLVQAVAAPTSTPAVAPPAPKKGFFEKMNEWADKASRQVGVTFVQGPWSIELRAQGILSENEFATKKTELLSRL
jgi:hypothetical protein